MIPLNGKKTHPLTATAKAILVDIRTSPCPCQEVNAGVGNRLMRGGLVEVVLLPSPYKNHKGKPIPFYKATEVKP